MIIFKTCCLYFKLETGAYIVGTLGLITSVFNFIVGSLVLDKVIEVHSLPAFVIGILFWSTTTLVCFVLLLIGARKRHHLLLLPYMCVDPCGTVGNIVGVITYLSISSDEILETKITFSVFILLACVISIYVWLCMLSLYLRFKREQDEKRNFKRIHMMNQASSS